MNPEIPTQPVNPTVNQIGGLGLWTMIDLVLTMSGAMRDKQGNEMLGRDPTFTK